MQGDYISLTFHKGYFAAVVGTDCTAAKRGAGESSWRLEMGQNTVTNCEWGHGRVRGKVEGQTNRTQSGSVQIKEESEINLAIRGQGAGQQGHRGRKSKARLSVFKVMYVKWQDQDLVTFPDLRIITSH